MRVMLALALLAYGCEADRPSNAPLDAGEGLPDPLPERDGAPNPDDWQDPPDGGDAGDAGGPEAGRPSDAGPDATSEPDPEPDSGPDPEPEDPCPPPLDGRLGVHVRDINGDPLEREDEVAVTLDVTAETPAEGPVWVRVLQGNGLLVEGSLTIQGEAELVESERTHLLFELPRLADVHLEWRTAVQAQYELFLVVAHLELERGRCENPNAGSGALLQLVGVRAKARMCVNLENLASLQIASSVPERQTALYREENGIRDDLLADDFIYCPQHPTIVHEVVFCVEGQPASVRLAGSHRADGGWEVDDFALFEVLRDDRVLADGVTSQSHPGGETFWCPETQELVCRNGCTATLSAGERQIEALAVVGSTGPDARTHADRSEAITDLLPDDGEPYDLKITALDTGGVGEVRPDLYLVLGRD